MLSNKDKDQLRTVSFYEHKVLIDYYIKRLAKKEDLISQQNLKIINLEGQLECAKAKLEINNQILT